jgi:beta-glucanase (GH16 family)
VLLFHSIGPAKDNQQEYSKDNFQKIINYLYEKRSEIKTVTLSEVMGANVIDLTAQELQPQKDGSGMKLVWEENFDSPALDTQNWNIIEAAPFKNSELQTYKPEGVSVKDRMLEITSGKDGGGYFSGAVTTENKQLFQYGRIEIRAKLSSGKGIFPAIWMLPQSGDPFPEVDIIEFLGHDPDSIWHVMHYEKGGSKKKYSFKTKGKKYDEGFHIFAFEWSETGVKWLIDGVETYAKTGYAPAGKMYLYINTAVGGDWPGNPDKTTQFPQTMLVDYIKYYR